MYYIIHVVMHLTGLLIVQIVRPRNEHTYSIGALLVLPAACFVASTNSLQVLCSVMKCVYAAIEPSPLGDLQLPATSI